MRVRQADWATPRCADWVAALDAAVARLTGDAVLVAHSSACALVAHWAAVAEPQRLARVRGALLVAPTDPEGPNYPAGPVGFGPMPQARLPFPSIVVASTDDEYVTVERAGAYAEAWGSQMVNVGAAGHVNGASGLGAWPAGHALLEELRRTPPMHGVTVAADDQPAWLALRREDLAAVRAKYWHDNRRPRQWIGVATGIGGLALAAALLTIADSRGWPDVLSPLIFVGGWTILLASFAVVWRRERQLKAHHQVPCPACDAPLLDRSLGRGGMSRLDLAIATGNCPACGAQILAP